MFSYTKFLSQRRLFSVQKIPQRTVFFIEKLIFPKENNLMLRETVLFSIRNVLNFQIDINKIEKKGFYFYFISTILTIISFRLSNVYIPEKMKKNKLENF